MLPSNCLLNSFCSAGFDQMKWNCMFEESQEIDRNRLKLNSETWDDQLNGIIFYVSVYRCMSLHSRGYYPLLPLQLPRQRDLLVKIIYQTSFQYLDQNTCYPQSIPWLCQLIAVSECVTHLPGVPSLCPLSSSFIQLPWSQGPRGDPAASSLTQQLEMY